MGIDWISVPSDVTELVVVRHGETTWNASGTLQGQAESDLNDIGAKQAEAVADRLAREHVHIAAVYSSDLKRAIKTAEIISSKCNCPQMYLKAGLRERHLGMLQGVPRKQAHILEPRAFQAFTSPSKDQPIPGGGESLNQLHSRAKTTIEDIAHEHRGQRVVVVTHGGVIRALHVHARGKLPSGSVSNASLNVFRISDTNEWNICLWSDVSHLKGLGSLDGGRRTDADSA